MIDFSKNPNKPTRCQANLGKKWIFLEKRALLAFKYSNYLPWCSKSENTNVPFLKKRHGGKFSLSSQFKRRRETSTKNEPNKQMHAPIQQQKQNKKLWNMFKLDSNNTVLMPFLLTLYVLHNVSIIDFAGLRKKSSKHFPWVPIPFTTSFSMSGGSSE